MTHEEQHAAIQAAFPGKRPVATWYGSCDWRVACAPLWVHLEYLHFDKTWRVRLLRQGSGTCLSSLKVSDLSSIPACWLGFLQEHVRVTESALAMHKANLRAIGRLSCGNKYLNQKT